MNTNFYQEQCDDQQFAIRLVYFTFALSMTSPYIVGSLSIGYDQFSCISMKQINNNLFSFHINEFKYPHKDFLNSRNLVFMKMQHTTLILIPKYCVQNQSLLNCFNVCHYCIDVCLFALKVIEHYYLYTCITV